MELAMMPHHWRSLANGRLNSLGNEKLHKPMNIHRTVRVMNTYAHSGKHRSIMIKYFCHTVNVKCGPNSHLKLLFHVSKVVLGR